MIKRHLGTVLSLALAAMATPLAVRADTQPTPVRAEAPIRWVDLTDGDPRYAVQITIGGTTLDAGLDTGSTGLCVLSWGLKPDDLGPAHGEIQYTYGAGTQLEGPTAQAMLTIGGLGGTSPVMAVRRISCSGDVPHCPVETLDPAQYGIQGDGLPGQGFKAILGIAMAGDRLPNPLTRMGVKRWIVELPQPGTSVPGKLILNPTADETADFTLFHLIPELRERSGADHDAIEACLANLDTHKHICGVGILDTGGNGLTVESPDTQPVWPKGTPAQLIFAQNDKAVTAMNFTIGRGIPSTMRARVDDHMAVTHLYLGALPYYGFDILYDPENHLIGLRPR